MKGIDLVLLGGFQMRLGTGAFVALPKKSQALIAYLALSKGQAQPRDKMAALLWSQASEEQARHSLRQTLVSIRKAVGDDTPLILTEADDLWLNYQAVSVDVLELMSLAESSDEDSLQRAAELYKGEFLEGLSTREESFDEWQLSQRERLWDLAVEVLARLLHVQLRSHLNSEAIKTAHRLLALDPLQEAVHRSLMLLYHQSGRREAAVRQYHTCVSILRRDLGIQPEQETQQLFEKVIHAESVRAPEAEGSRILVVEDDQVTRTYLEGLLKNCGYTVVLAEDGEDALRRLGGDRFDLILTDINMPNLSGLNLLESMNSAGISTPVMLLTGVEDEETEVKGLKIGAADYVRKPIRRDAFLQRVRNVLRSPART